MRPSRGADSNPVLGPLGAGTPASPGRRGTAGAALLANAANSASNLLVVVLLARATGTREFGSIALVLTLVPLAVAFFRGAVVEPLVALATRPDTTSGRREAVVAGCLTGIAVMTAAFVLLRGDMQALAVPLGIGAGVTIVVERDRWSALGGKRPRRGALTDAAWLAVQLAGLAAAPNSAVVAAWAWAVGGTAAVVLGRLLAMRWEEPPTRSGGQQLRPWWGVEYVVAVANLQLALLVLPLTAGVEATGALRAASSMLGFTTVLTSATFQLGMRRMRSLSNSAHVQQTMWRVSLVSSALMLALTVPLLLLPPDVGRALLGATWEGARKVLPVLLLQKVVVTAALGPMIAVRVLDRSEGLVRARVFLALATVVGALAAGRPMGASGAAWAMTVASVAGTSLWFVKASKAAMTTQRVGT